MKTMRLFFLALALGTVPTFVGGCGASLASIIAVAENYLQYVTTFVQIAEGIWNVISPLLGANAPAANAQFAKAIVDVNNACAALSEAISVAQIANNPNPNLQALINDCVTAVDEVAAAIAQYQTVGTAKAGVDLTQISHMQAVIHRWRH